MIVNIIIISLITIFILIKQIFYIKCECRLRKPSDSYHSYTESQEKQEEDEEEEDEEETEEIEEIEEEQINKNGCSEGCLCKENTTPEELSTTTPDENNNSQEEDTTDYSEMPPLI